MDFMYIYVSCQSLHRLCTPWEWMVYLLSSQKEDLWKGLFVAHNNWKPFRGVIIYVNTFHVYLDDTNVFTRVSYQSLQEWCVNYHHKKMILMYLHIFFRQYLRRLCTPWEWCVNSLDGYSSVGKVVYQRPKGRRRSRIKPPKFHSGTY